MSRVELPDGTVCLCGHGPVKHPEGMDGECIAPGCGCKKFRDRAQVQAQANQGRVRVDRPVVRPPRPPVVRPPAPAPVPAGPRQPRTVNELIELAMQTGTPSLVRQAEKLSRQVTELYDAYRRDLERVAARAEVERLERQLAEARAKAGYLCEDCGQSCGSPAGLGAHRKRVHGVEGKSRSV